MNRMEVTGQAGGDGLAVRTPGDGKMYRLVFIGFIQKTADTLLGFYMTGRLQTAAGKQLCCTRNVLCNAG